MRNGQIWKNLLQGSCVVPTGLYNLSVPAGLWFTEAKYSGGPAQRLSFNKRQQPISLSIVSLHRRSALLIWKTQIIL